MLTFLSSFSSIYLKSKPCASLDTDSRALSICFSNVCPNFSVMEVEEREDLLISERAILVILHYETGHYNFFPTTLEDDSPCPTKFYTSHS